MLFGVRSKAMRVVLGWQISATGALALVAGLAGGVHAGVSTLLGGLVSILAGWIYAVLGAAGRSKQSAGSALFGVLRAEAVKVLAIVAGLAVALTAYREVVALAFLGTFALATLIFAMAIFVREH